MRITSQVKDAPKSPWRDSTDEDEEWEPLEGKTGDSELELLEDIGDLFKSEWLELLFEELEFEESKLSFEELEELELSFEEELEEEVDEGLSFEWDEDSGSTPQPTFNKFCGVRILVKDNLSSEVKVPISAT